MELRKIRHAIALSRYLNFTRAAQSLNITQSALSRSIQALEAECRLQLFDRNRGAVSLTQAGREFIRHAEGLVRSEEALRGVIGQSAQGEGGSIALGVIPLIARVLLAPVLAKRIAQPHFRAEVTIASSQELFPMIMQEGIDLAICMGDPPPGNAFSAMKLGELSLAVIVRKDHPLTRLASFGPAEVEQYPVVRSTPFSYGEFSTSFMGLSPGRSPNVTVEDFDVLSQIVAASDAVWMTAPVAARLGLQTGQLVDLPISWYSDTVMPVMAYSLGHRTLSPLAASILEHFTELCADLN